MGIGSQTYAGTRLCCAARRTIKHKRGRQSIDGQTDDCLTTTDEEQQAGYDSVFLTLTDRLRKISWLHFTHSRERFEIEIGSLEIRRHGTARRTEEKDLQSPFFQTTDRLLSRISITHISPFPLDLCRHLN